MSAALAEASAVGMGQCAQALALQEQKRVLEQEAAILRDLRAALQKLDLDVRVLQPMHSAGTRIHPYIYACVQTFTGAAG